MHKAVSTEVRVQRLGRQVQEMLGKHPWMEAIMLFIQ